MRRKEEEEEGGIGIESELISKGSPIKDKDKSNKFYLEIAHNME